ncbi:hypothetical protein [Candidatus Caldatribacterium saccharofermentans]|uniref:hypothetical protein n=1 Tax=Candidatus Caldatribacterium saccharofermentans TaxID=1454753 RepID=UPI003D091906
MTRRRNDSGATFVGIAVSLSLLALLVGVVLLEVRILLVVRASAELKTQALMLAVNTMESIKSTGCPPSPPGGTDGLIVRWDVREFSPRTVLCEVVVTREDGGEIFALRTLRKRGISAP